MLGKGLAPRTQPQPNVAGAVAQSKRGAVSAPTSAGSCPSHGVGKAVGLGVGAVPAAWGGRCRVRVLLLGDGLSVLPLAFPPRERCCICHSSCALCSTATKRRSRLPHPGSTPSWSSRPRSPVAYHPSARASGRNPSAETSPSAKVGPAISISRSWLRRSWRKGRTRLAPRRERSRSATALNVTIAAA